MLHFNQCMKFIALRLFDYLTFNEFERGGCSRIYIYVTVAQDNWILGGIARELRSVISEEVKIGCDVQEIQKTDFLIFMHYETATDFLLRNRSFIKNRRAIWFTHPRRADDLGQLTYREVLRKSTIVFASCSEYQKLLTENGIKNSVFVPYGADRGLFKFSPSNYSKSIKVGISSSYYDRKNPNLLKYFLETYPTIEFHFVGGGWKENTDFAKFKNFYNYRLSYQEYPNFYNNISLLLNCSTLEGGPIGVIEALACGTPVCSSRVGIVPDIIQQNVNGMIFDLKGSERNATKAFDAALKIPRSQSISKSVEKFSWENLGNVVTKIYEDQYESIYSHE